MIILYHRANANNNKYKEPCKKLLKPLNIIKIQLKYVIRILKLELE